MKSIKKNICYILFGLIWFYFWLYSGDIYLQENFCVSWPPLSDVTINMTATLERHQASKIISASSFLWPKEGFLQVDKNLNLNFYIFKSIQTLVENTQFFILNKKVIRLKVKGGLKLPFNSESCHQYFI